MRSTPTTIDVNDAEPDELSAEQLREILRRATEIEAHRAQLVDGGSFIADARKRIAEHRSQ